MLYDFLDWRRHVLALMCTCKALYLAGVKCLLGFGVEVDHGSKLLSFCQFMHRDLGARPLFLRKLVQIGRAHV